MSGKCQVVLCCLLLLLFAYVPSSTAQLFYASTRGGGTVLGDTDFDAVAIEFEPGAAALGALGIYVESGRMEAEVGYRRNNIDKISYRRKGSTFDPGGIFSVWSFMVNSIADYETGSDFLPYLGVGAGAARISLEEDLSLGVAIDKAEDWVFAYHGMLGFGYPLMKRLTLDFEYRYFAILKPEFAVAGGEAIEFDYATHNAMLGLRYAF